jgi:integral membrane protein (TIGR01906 family)
MGSIRSALATLVIGVAAAIVLLALAILPFLNPVWVGFEQERAGSGAWTGFAPADLRAVTDAILADLVLGPPEFDVALDGQPVLNERERGHMRDVRAVFGTFYVLAGIAAIVLVGAFLTARGPRARARLWRRLGLSGRVIAVATIAGGIAGLLFFDTAFLLFHELFFPPDSFLFDPSTERLVQLFPETFWIETAVGVGVVVILLGLGLAWLGARRSAALEPRAAAVGDRRIAPAP